jgi:hypothetical protein
MSEKEIEYKGYLIEKYTWGTVLSRDGVDIKYDQLLPYKTLSQVFITKNNADYQ